MESDNSSHTAIKPPPLNSDQLNYLIWRYLQESGYGEAAVKLQRDWKVDPETLPFAKHVKGPALVSLVQKGLRYHHLSLTIDEHGRTSKPLDPNRFFFGPEGARSDNVIKREPLIRTDDAQRSLSPISTNVAVVKKREAESNGLSDPSAQSAKRSRKSAQSNSERNGSSARKPSSTASNNDPPAAMDVDQVNGHFVPQQGVSSPAADETTHDETVINGVNSDNRMEMDVDVEVPSGHPQLHEEVPQTMPPLVHTLTNGESIGIQVAPAKVANLSPSTSILNVTDDSHLTNIQWQPGDRSILTASGHTFCGVWRLAGANLRQDAIKPAFQNLAVPTEVGTVTAFAWHPDRTAIAIATYTGHGGHLHIFDGEEMMFMEDLPASQKPVTSLKWLRQGTSPGLRIVGITPLDQQLPDQGVASTITLWHVGGVQSEPSTVTVPELLYDIDTPFNSVDDPIVTAGGSALYSFNTTSDGKLVQTQRWTTSPQENDNWSFVKCTSRNAPGDVLVAASADNPRLWLPTKDIIVGDAHEAPITGLQLRFRSGFYGDRLAPWEFATSSADGNIKVWQFDMNNKSVNVIHKLNIDQISPIMTISYSPDGFCLAGASYGDVRIYNAEHGYNLMASWQASDAEWKGTTMKEEDAMSIGGRSSINGDSGSADHTLAWDADSKKLAFGLASQVAVINFQR